MFHSYFLCGHGPKGIVRLRMGRVEEGGLGAGRTLLNKTARRSEQFVSICVAGLFVGRRSAGRPGLDFASLGAADRRRGRHAASEGYAAGLASRAARSFVWLLLCASLSAGKDGATPASTAIRAGGDGA